jgi:Fe-S oxidoreductase
VLDSFGTRIWCVDKTSYLSVDNPMASREFGNRMADRVRSTGVIRVASANPGCEMQLRAHLGGAHDVAHPIEWYLRALEGGE